MVIALMHKPFFESTSPVLAQKILELTSGQREADKEEIIPYFEKYSAIVIYNLSLNHSQSPKYFLKFTKASQGTEAAPRDQHNQSSLGVGTR